ncbi:putative protein kinase RLK-Pelle-CrRLK1L-1 family [Medicago truncatula]|uniref:Protein kinase domain-containing protein n=1 Tax=Medicago truncatula TaxID=3880 RepID=A0A396H0P8_MEDTR|nr:putative protein kinase RLK-Pelle-CrRLK1L-1 family [Medicago truncatula]
MRKFSCIKKMKWSMALSVITYVQGTRFHSLGKKRLEICIGAAKGLHYLHTGAKRPIFHRDVKPYSILLDNNMAPKLSQFGLSLQGKLSKSESKPIEVNAICGTYGFMAPEYAFHGILTDKSDVYSFVFMNIMKRCLNSGEPNERPTMGEVEVELEHALALQEEADRGESNILTFYE